MRDKQKRQQRPFLKLVETPDFSDAKAILRDPAKIAPVERAAFAKRLAEIIRFALDRDTPTTRKHRRGS
jgi:hypothetical protein